MKLLLENWREYLDEGLKPGPGMTIADLVDLIHTGRQLEQGDDLDKIMSKLAMVLGEEFVAWPLVGIGIAAASMAAGGGPEATAVALAALPAAHRLLGDFYRKKRKDGFFKDDPKEYPVLDYSDWTTTGHLKVAKFILKKDNEYLKRIHNTFAQKKDRDKYDRHTEQVERLQDVKNLDGDDDFASYWLPKLRKSFYIMRSSKSDGKFEASQIISSARDSLRIPNPNLI